jgi:hypothetical protein
LKEYRCDPQIFNRAYIQRIKSLPSHASLHCALICTTERDQTKAYNDAYGIFHASAKRLIKRHRLEYRHVDGTIMSGSQIYKIQNDVKKAFKDVFDDEYQTTFYVGQKCRISYSVSAELSRNKPVTIVDLDQTHEEIRVNWEDGYTKHCVIKEITISRDIAHAPGMSCRVSWIGIPLIDAFATNCFKLQGSEVRPPKTLTIDNSRCGNSKDRIYNKLYSMITRVKEKAQLAFVHPVTNDEVRNVDHRAVLFDTYHRIKKQVISKVDYNYERNTMYKNGKVLSVENYCKWLFVNDSISVEQQRWL